MVECFCKNSNQILGVNFFREKVPSQMFDWVSNRPWLLVRNKEINDLIGKTGIECESPVFRNFKQTLHYYALYMIVSHFFTG